MTSQKISFLQGEGDAYFDRNRFDVDSREDPVIVAMRDVGIKPVRLLEIGASSGAWLAAAQKALGAECHGIDPSPKAVEYGCAHYPDVRLSRSTADTLSFEDRKFDCVVFGFCLYLCDPADYFRIAQEADRVLADRGFLIIKDFSSPVPLKNPYKHRPGVFSHKFDWARMFTWNPVYRHLSRRYLEHDAPYGFQAREAVAVDILLKDYENAFIHNP